MPPHLVKCVLMHTLLVMFYHLMLMAVLKLQLVRKSPKLTLVKFVLLCSCSLLGRLVDLPYHNLSVPRTQYTLMMIKPLPRKKRIRSIYLLVYILQSVWMRSATAAANAVFAACLS